MTDWPCQCGEDGWVEIDGDKNKYPCRDCYLKLVLERIKNGNNGNR